MTTGKMTPAKMTPERWQQVEEVFETAIELPTEEREAFLTQVCDGDDELRTEVASLLANEAEEAFFQSAVKDGAKTFARAAVEEIVGQRVGVYRLTGLVGQGGMGAVYRAVRDDDQFNQQVAIKVIKRGMDTSLVLRRFWRERQILASLNHPHIARLLDGGTTPDGRPYFAMEFIAGQQIGEYCDAHQLSIPDRLKLFRQVCAAVQFAHQNLIVHRDLKPGNILVDQDGVPKLLDFGIAKLLSSDTGQAATRTVTGMRMMTPDYASPEQVRGGTITTASDIYSLGTVLYELLTGRRAHQFKTYSPVEIEETVCLSEAEKPSDAVRHTTGAPSRWHKQLTGDLDNIVLMALRKEPDRRYQSVEQFSEDIRRHLEGLPVAARKDTVGYRADKFARRNKLAIAAVALVMLSLMGGIVGTARAARIAQAERVGAESERGRAERNLVEAQAQRAQAEVQRAEAEAQRSEAEQQRGEAFHQRVVAEAQAAEAHRQRAIAETEQAKAERRFGQVRKLANTFLFDFSDQIRDLPGSTKAREMVAKTALEYLDSLAQEAEGDASLQMELAAAYLRLGALQGNPQIPNLGQPVAALASFRKSVSIAEKLRAGCHTDYLLLRRLGDALFYIGMIERRSGKFAEARQSFQQELSLVEGLMAAGRRNEETYWLLLNGSFQFGEVTALTGGDADAVPLNRKLVEINERWLAELPSERASSALGVSYMRLGQALNDRGDLEESLTTLRRALSLEEELSRAAPTSVIYRGVQASIHNSLGHVLGQPGSPNLGRPAEAVAHYRQAVAIETELAAADPNNALARTSLKIYTNNLAAALAERR